jgi:hypothetical protein
MLSKDCKNCKYVAWLVGLGQGVRCLKEENQKYLPEGELFPVVISYVPENCKYFETK